MRKHLTYGNVMATLALFVALGGSAIAAGAIITRPSQLANGVVTGKKVKNGAVTNKKVKRGTLSADRLSAAARASLTGPQGPAGPAGAPGAAGANGANGANGSALAYAQIAPGSLTFFAARTRGFATLTRPATGTYCLGLEASVAAQVFDARGSATRPTIVTPEWGNTRDQQNDITVYGRGANSICGDNLLEVHTYRGGAEADNVAFFVVVP